LVDLRDVVTHDDGVFDDDDGVDGGDAEEGSLSRFILFSFFVPFLLQTPNLHWQSQSGDC
jgi:hypothetical protein